MKTRAETMNHFREDDELLGDALRRAYDVPEDEDDRFRDLLERLKRTSEKAA